MTRACSLRSCSISDLRCRQEPQYQLTTQGKSGCSLQLKRGKCHYKHCLQIWERTWKLEKLKCLTCCISPVWRPSSAAPGCVRCRPPSLKRYRRTLRKHKKSWFKSRFSHQARFSPDLQAVNVLLLLLPALLSRLLIANLSAYFLQNPLFALIEKRFFSAMCGMAALTGAVTGGSLPSWGAAGWAESPPPLPTASSHLHWESAPVRTVGKSVAPAEEMHGVTTNVESAWFKTYWELQEKSENKQWNKQPKRIEFILGQPWIKRESCILLLVELSWKFPLLHNLSFQMPCLCAVSRGA